jgi:tetratricopeptide (TPR) repeat protein
MELVEGLPLNEYARQHGLETNQRLELIAQIGDAVQHAHERNVIHRDLKPANILVESSGQPKILDFGVARATDVDLQAVTLQTDVGQLVGTLPYMSPEQAAGDPARIGPGSDVYSLGVICYELLTGTLPYDTRGKSPIDATRIIREQEPLRLTSVHTRFRGDIETIVLNALEKDPARRYQTAAAMAEDIRRYLRHEPIQARQPSPAYRAVKFVRRHRILVSALVLAFAAILTGLGFATYGLVQARQERDRALQALALSEAVEGFFADMVNAASPRREGRDATLSNLLDKSAAELSAAKVDNAATRAVLQNAIGRTYLALHRLPEAETHLKKALDLAESSLGEHVKTMTIMHNLGEVYLELGQLDQAEALLDRSLALCRRLLGGDHQHAAHINNVLATVYSRSGRYEKAAVIYRMVLETQRQRLGPDHEQTVGAAFNLARLYVRTKKFELAEPMLQNLRETLTRLEGPASYGTLMSCDALGELYTFQKRYDEAEPNFRAAYDGFLDQLGPTNPQTNTAQQNLGFVCLELGRIDEANTILRSDAQRQRIRDGTSSEAIVSNLVYLGVRFKDAGRLQEAEAALEDAKSAATHLNPSGGIALAVIMLNLGKVRLELANYSEAEANLREALERFQNLPAKYQEKVEKVCQSLADLSARTGQPPPSDVCSLPEQDAKERDTSGS